MISDTCKQWLKGIIVCVCALISIAMILGSAHYHAGFTAYSQKDKGDTFYTSGGRYIAELGDSDTVKGEGADLSYTGFSHVYLETMNYQADVDAVNAALKKYNAVVSRESEHKRHGLWETYKEVSVPIENGQKLYSELKRAGRLTDCNYRLDAKENREEEQVDTLLKKPGTANYVSMEISLQEVHVYSSLDGVGILEKLNMYWLSGWHELLMCIFAGVTMIAHLWVIIAIIAGFVILALIAKRRESVATTYHREAPVGKAVEVNSLENERNQKKDGGEGNGEET